MRRTIVVVSIMALALGVFPAGVGQADENDNSEELRDSVTVAGVRKHQRALQAIADANGGTRLSGTPGYDASVQYVVRRAKRAGYKVTLQPFDFLLVGDASPPVLQRITSPAQNFADGNDFMSMQYSGSGDVTAPVTAVDLVVPSPEANTSTSGCESDDFLGFPAGSIALMQRGTCNFSVKADNAATANAAGVIIFNEGNPGRTAVLDGTLSPPLRSLPV